VVKLAKTRMGGMGARRRAMALAMQLMACGSACVRHAAGMQVRPFVPVLPHHGRAPALAPPRPRPAPLPFFGDGSCTRAAAGLPLPGRTPASARGLCSTAVRASSAGDAAEDLALQIQAQGDRVRALKADKAEKAEIDAAVHELLALKARLSGGSPPSNPAAAGTRRSAVRVEEVSKGKGGGTTIIRGLEDLSTADAKSLLKSLRTALSVGAKAAKDGSLVVQGKHADTILLKLQQRGYTDVKAVGGAGAKMNSKGARLLAWNAPKELQAQAEEEKREMQRRKERAAQAARAAAKSPEAMARARLAQARKSEAQVLALLEQLPPNNLEKQAELEAKLARIRAQLS